jgi:hypothetical protein
MPLIEVPVGGAIGQPPALSQPRLGRVDPRGIGTSYTILKRLIEAKGG